VYLRNGPNRRYAARGRYHWFDGDGMVHAVYLEDGLHRALRAALQQRQVLHARVHTVEA
jgi:carotenoid cleavage dioxygenase-like enzyme